jgi:hypothetical protein
LFARPPTLPSSVRGINPPPKAVIRKVKSRTSRTTLLTIMEETSQDTIEEIIEETDQNTIEKIV